MYTVEFVLTGKMPLLIHSDDVEASDSLREWREDTTNKNASVPGDDRSPPWTWQTYLYTDGEKLVWPSYNLMVGMRRACTQVKIPGKRGKTYKELSQNGMNIPAEFCQLLVAGKEVPMSAIRSE